MKIITRDDLIDIVVKAQQRGLKFLLSKFGFSKSIRTKSAFDQKIISHANWWIIPIAQAILGIGLVARIVGTALRDVNPEMRNAAKVLGASDAKVWRHVDLPIISRSLVAGASFSFAIAIGEFGATAFLVRPQRPTIPTTIFNLLGRPGASTYGQAMALCVVLAGITAISISLLDRTGTVIRDAA